MPKTDIIDISHYQADPDWPVLKQTLAGVIFKCTEGADNVDPTFAARRQKCLAQSIPHAAYHFLRGGDYKRQLIHYLGTLKPRVGERVILDHEDSNFSLTELETAVAWLASDPRELQITIYSGSVIKEQLAKVNHSLLLTEHTSLWLAQYTTGSPSWPDNAWPTWTLWQFTDEGMVPGVINGKCDCNMFNGSRENAVKWLNPAIVATKPKDDATPPIVTMTINAPAGVNVSILLNGKVLGS